MYSLNMIDELIKLLLNKVFREVILEVEDESNESIEFTEYTFYENPYRFCPNCNCVNCMEIKLK